MDQLCRVRSITPHILYTSGTISVLQKTGIKESEIIVQSAKYFKDSLSIEETERWLLILCYYPMLILKAGRDDPLDEHEDESLLSQSLWKKTQSVTILVNKGRSSQYKIEK